MPVDRKRIAQLQAWVQDVRASRVDLSDPEGQQALALDEVLAERAKMIQLLRKVEWAGMEGRFCPVCDGPVPDHATDCSLAAFLRS